MNTFLILVAIYLLICAGVYAFLRWLYSPARWLKQSIQQWKAQQGRMLSVGYGLMAGNNAMNESALKTDEAIRLFDTTIRALKTAERNDPHA